jgi:hypothetical protein
MEYRFLSERLKFEERKAVEVITRRSRATPCPREAVLRTAHATKEGERELAPNNNKAKPEQLKLSKTYPSTWS